MNKPELVVGLAAWDGVIGLVHLSWLASISRLAGGKGLFFKTSIGLLIRLGFAPTVIPCFLLAAVSAKASLICISCFAALYVVTGAAVWYFLPWAIAVQLLLSVLNVALLLARPMMRLFRIEEGTLPMRLLPSGFSLAYCCMAWASVYLLLR